MITFKLDSGLYALKIQKTRHFDPNPLTKKYQETTTQVTVMKKVLVTEGGKEVERWRPICGKVDPNSDKTRVYTAIKTTNFWVSDSEARRECIVNLTRQIPTFANSRTNRLLLWNAYYKAVDQGKDMSNGSKVVGLLGSIEAPANLIRNLQNAVKKAMVPVNERPKGFPNEAKIAALQGSAKPVTVS